MKHYDAVLFDLGGVYTESPFAVIEGMADDMGAAADLVHRILFGDYEVDSDHPWHRLERGEVSLTDAREAILELGREHELEVDPFQLFARTGTGKGTREPLIERTRALRNEGYKTALVTNNFAEVREAWRSLLPVEELFDVVVDSSEIGMRKPNAGIYHHALSLLTVDAERSVFVDDFPGNVTAARQLGMGGVVVGSDIAKAIRELDELLTRAPGGSEPE